MTKYCCKQSAPEIGLERSTGYTEGDTMHLLCFGKGHPAPHLTWSYVRLVVLVEQGVDRTFSNHVFSFVLKFVHNKLITKDRTLKYSWPIILSSSVPTN